MRKKILIIIPSIRYGGQEKVAVKTARLLSNEYNVTLLVFLRSKQEIATNGLKVISCGEEKWRIGKYLNRYKTVKLLKKKEQFSACISFSPGANLINVLTKAKEKTITSIRGFRSIYSNSGKIRFLIRRADKMICVSEKIAKVVRERYEMPDEWANVLYNPYNIEEIKELGGERVKDYNYEGFTICNVSHLNEVKGLEHLLRAFSIIHKKRADARLLIVGDGILSEALLELTRMLGLNGSVSFIGYRENPYKYIAKSDLYIMTSENEGFPNSLVEAMVFTPVISVDCETGPWEILGDKSDTKPESKYEICRYGILTPPVQPTHNYTSLMIEKEESIIAEAAVKLIEDRELYIKLKAAAYTRALQFNDRAYLDKLITIVEQ